MLWAGLLHTTDSLATSRVDTTGSSWRSMPVFLTEAIHLLQSLEFPSKEEGRGRGGEGEEEKRGERSGTVNPLNHSISLSRVVRLAD